jgi:hypothetical protein
MVLLEIGGEGGVKSGNERRHPLNMMSERLGDPFILLWGGCMET